MDENKHFRCSFCGKTEQEVDKLLSGPGVYICNECIDMCNSILDGEFEHKGGFTATELPKPKEIKAFLDEYVVGQEDAKKPFSDQKLKEQLERNGIRISRRTVTKYREEIQIPDYRMRKTY